jgi:hypothetical protein
VRGVLSDQEEAGNEQKSDQDERPAPAYLMVMVVHTALF